MVTLKKHNEGFTVFELLIVLIVIGVLAVIVIYTYSGIQAKTRNTQRETALRTVQVQLEDFYNQNGYYPDITDLNSATWRATNMPNLPSSTLADPSSTCNPSTSGCVVDKPQAKAYAYQATQLDGITGCNGPLGSGADQNCAKYTLTAVYEGAVDSNTTDVLHSQQ